MVSSAMCNFMFLFDIWITVKLKAGNDNDQMESQCINYYHHIESRGINYYELNEFVDISFIYWYVTQEIHVLNDMWIRLVIGIFSTCHTFELVVSQIQGSWWIMRRKKTSVRFFLSFAQCNVYLIFIQM